MKRKLIVLISACPEEPYQQSVFRGIFEQCNKYGYNLAVFSSNVQNYNFYSEYWEGEQNIYNLINFDYADGVIVTTVPISNNHQSSIETIVREKLEKECKAKVISLDLPLDNYETIYVDDRTAFKNITDHVVEVHGAKKIYCLTGYEDIESSQKRVGGYRDSLEAHGIEYRDDYVFYGNFWYEGGEILAERIISGEVEKPEAVVCANDNMATALTNKLVDAGFKIPGDIIITGYDAISEAFLNKTTITTYSPDIYSVGAEAVNRLREVLEPGEKVEEISRLAEHGMIFGQSCGCANVDKKKKHYVNSFIYHMNRGNTLIDEQDPYDIARLADSYMYETLISCRDTHSMLRKLDEFTYLIKPFKEFFLVLRDDWMDINKSYVKGYPEKMHLQIHRNVPYEKDSRTGNGLFTPDDVKGERCFDTKLMLEDMHEESDIPHVYYFSPVHFSKETLGYTVIKCELTQEIKIASVFRNWIRDIGNALEMSRIRARLLDESFEDQMTGLFNRRGMYFKYNEIKAEKHGKQIYVVMVDMDRLKYINDSFGHEEGDFGIKVIAEAIKNNTRVEDICVRSGGDEFLIVGFGNNMEESIKARIETIRAEIEDKSKVAGKPYTLSASFGYVIEEFTEGVNLDNIMNIADEKMYEEKKIKHAMRTE